MKLTIQGHSARQFIAVGALGVCLLGAVHGLARHEERNAQAEYVRTSSAEFEAAAISAEAKLGEIYRNLRTLSLLPGVREISRHGENVTPDMMGTFQQIYNNLASRIDVSEVYIVPADINPDRLDAITGKLEEPILMFDELIINGGRGRESEASAGTPGSKLEAELEIFEYRQYAEQFAWFRHNAPHNESFSGLNAPMISGPPVITCDNRYFNTSKNDADRTGMSFAVPFYGLDGKLEGSVVAVILNASLRQMLPPKDFALVNTGYKFISAPSDKGQENASRDWAAKARPDPSLLFSKGRWLFTADPANPWYIWSGKPDAQYWQSPEARTIRKGEWAGYAITLAIMGLLLNYIRLHARNVQLAQKVDVERFVTLGKLTATVSHELRNPLGAIRNSIFMINELAEGNAEIRDFAARAERNVVRCDSIIADLLEYTRSNAVQPKAIDARAWLKSIAAEMRPPAGVALRTDSFETPVMAMIDAERLRRAVINLVENAGQAIVGVHKSGSVTLRCREDGTRAVIEVADTGPGIAKDVLPHIFEALFTTKSFGAGLGLPISRKLVELHDGTIAVDSTPGEGTVFTIRLPLAITLPLQKAA